VTGKKFSKPAMSRVINGDVELFETPKAPPKTRLDHILVQKHPEFNRSTLQHFIKNGYVTVDGVITQKPNTLIEPGQIVILTPPTIEKTEYHPDIIYEDNHVIVLNKPTGLLSMAKGEYCPEPTLEDFGLLVHRLDRDTSGVVILAKDSATQKMLRRQFQDRKTHKTYYAVVEGHPKLPEALIDLPIERNLKKPNTFLVGPNGKASQTYYKVIKQNNRYSLLELKPTTGRTHQLRVHLSHLGVPILGDRVYNSHVTEASNSRLFLHAFSLEITIPSDDGPNLRRTFTAPLPPEFDDVLR
ncbi:RluA family pseudouridine synthase, partial [Candidatus Saccharibacteria bacterium]|nr:RluA family pseudouridine synthase [Candidatus Saccharibacteria bacterium]